MIVTIDGSGVALGEEIELRLSAVDPLARHVQLERAV